MGRKSKNKLWALIKEKHDDAEANRLPYQRKWLLNIAFYKGHQYTYYNTAAEQLMAVKLPKHRIYVVDNQILPRVRRQVSDAIRQRPIIEVLPNTTDQADIQAARLGTHVLKHFWRENHISRKLRLLNIWRFTTGNAFLDDRWDPKAGPIQVTEDGKLVYLGDVDCGVWSPFEIGIPATTHVITSIHDLPWITKEKFRTCQWIKDKYGKEVDPEPFSGVSLTPFKNNSPVVEPGALVIELYMKPCAEFPNGIFLTGANGTILARQDYPFQFFNIEHFKDIDVPGEFYGQATMENAIDLQKQWNKTVSSIMEFNHSMGKGKWLFPRNCNVQAVPDDTHGEALEYTPVMGHKPEHLTLKGLPSSYIVALTHIRLSFEDLFSQHEVTRGTNKSDIRSGEMVGLLLEQDAIGSRPASISYEESLEAVMTRVLKRIQKGYATERIIKIAGHAQEYEAIPFKGADLRDNTDVYVKRGSSLPESRIGRQAMIMKRYEQGLYGNPADGEVRRHVMQLLDDAVVKDIYAEDLLDETNARIENRNMLEMAQRGRLQAPEVNSYDNHAIHVAECRKFLKSYEIQKLKESDPDLFRNVSLIVTQHMQQHQQFLQQALAMMAKLPATRPVTQEGERRVRPKVERLYK